MFSNDLSTFAALNSLKRAAQSSSRPMILWIGAGTSAWIKYPLWADLASEMHSLYRRERPNYQADAASASLMDSDFPAVFQKMKECDQTLYFSSLANAFGPMKLSAVYERFLRTAKALSPLSIVTTNVDETLEHHISNTQTVQRFDIERLPQLLQAKSSFIAKLHGSISAVESTVFTTDDYKVLTDNQLYVDVIRDLLANNSVFFLGYGIRDAYVIRALQAAAGAKPLFGSGPHFVVTSSENAELPDCVHRIRYDPNPKDHRGALQALEEMVNARDIHGQKSDAVPAESTAPEQVRAKSRYFITDILAPGKRQSGATFTYPGKDGRTCYGYAGEGYVDGEIRFENYSHLHDVVVGLICFDEIYFEAKHVNNVHAALGGQYFWEFVKEGSIRLITLPTEPMIVHHEADYVGHLGAGTVYSEGPKTTTLESEVRNKIPPPPGFESEHEQLLALLDSTQFDVLAALKAESRNYDSELPSRTHSALMHPSIRSLLGMSDGTPNGRIPLWLAYPVIRLAWVVRRGLVAELLQASAVRMLWGCERLATAAFSAAVGEEWADDAASYVLAGRYEADLGEVVRGDPSLLAKLVDFRQSSAGEKFRLEIAERLAVERGADLQVAINAGLSQALPPAVVQAARDKIAGLFVSKQPGTKLLPAFWGNIGNSDERVAGWRKQSKVRLAKLVSDKQISAYDLCPCGSGEKFRFCCDEALLR